MTTAELDLWVTVYVPAAEAPAATTAMIRPGSAIVGSSVPADSADGRVLVDVEGDTHGHLEGFAAKLMHAAGRHLARYPTTARFAVDARHLTPVGTYHYLTRQAHLDAPEQLAIWAGLGQTLLLAQLRLSHMDAQLREFSRARAFTRPADLLRAQTVTMEHQRALEQVRAAEQTAPV